MEQYSQSEVPPPPRYQNHDNAVINTDSGALPPLGIGPRSQQFNYLHRENHKHSMWETISASPFSPHNGFLFILQMNSNVTPP